MTASDESHGLNVWQLRGVDFKARMKRAGWQPVVCALLFVLLTVVRVYLGTHTVLILRGNWKHDDGQAISLIISIFEGDWLGEWSRFTLIKSCIYPLFVAVACRLGLSYPLALYLLYAASVYLVVVAFSPVVRNRWMRLGIYAFLLFTPVMFNYNTVQYVYRNAIVPATTLLVIGSFSGAFFRRDDCWSLLRWLLLGGLSLSFFYFICENSIWLGLFAGAALVVTAVYVLVERRPKRLVALLILPLCVVAVVRGGLGAINDYYYGTTALNVRTETSFADMIAALMRIERHEEDTDEHIWISAGMMADALEASPTLQSCSEEIAESYLSWSGSDEISGDFTQWVLLDALYSAGYCDSAEELEEFCAVVAAELEEAFEDGTLVEADTSVLRLSSTTRGISASDVSELLERVGEALGALVTYSQAQSIYESSSPTNYEAITQILGTSYVATTSELAGWCFAWDDAAELTAVLLNADGEELVEVVFEESDDVAAAFPEYANASVARFTIDLDEFEYEAGDELSLAVYLDGAYCATVELAKGQVDYGEFILTIDSIPQAVEASYSVLVTDVSNGIIGIYQATALPVLAIAIVGFFVNLVGVFLAKDPDVRMRALFMAIITTGLLACFIALVVGNSWYMSFYDGDTFLWKVFNYSTGGVVALQVVEALCISQLVSLCAHFARRNDARSSATSNELSHPSPNSKGTA